MTAVIGRIFKFVALVAVAAAVAGAMIARSKLDRAARVAADRALAGGTAVEHGAVHGRLWPPAAVVEDVRFRGAGGAKLLRAQRLIVPIVLWGTSSEPMRLEHWTMELRVPRAGAVPVRALLAGDGFPALDSWEAEDGRIELRAGDPPASASLVLIGVRASRHGESLRVDGGVEGGSGTLRLEGSLAHGRFAGQLALGPLDAIASAPLLVDPSEAQVRGGRVTFEGALSADARNATFAGDVDAVDVIVEGKGKPGAFEARLRAEGSRARVPLAVGIDLARGVDGPRVLREAIASREKGAP